jgi:hypothetical protein
MDTLHRITSRGLLKALDRLDRMPVTARVLSVYGENRGVALTDDDVISAVYGSTGGPLSGLDTLRVLVQKLRRLGAPLRATDMGYLVYGQDYGLPR